MVNPVNKECRKKINMNCGREEFISIEQACVIRKECDIKPERICS
jgi:hypothetical protein